jgi:two-component system nitrogen regulation response regulator GlnG
LVADDDTAIRTVLNQALARAGYVPRTTSERSHALVAGSVSGDGRTVVITDVVMPDENAFDICPAHPQAPGRICRSSS